MEVAERPSKVVAAPADGPKRPRGAKPKAKAAPKPRAKAEKKTADKGGRAKKAAAKTA